MPAVDGAGRRRGPLPAVAAWLPVVLCAAVYFLFQSGGLTLEIDRSIEFRCNAQEYGLVPAEIAHPGRRATDVFCEPGEHAEDDGHGHERSDARLPADAPAAVTPFTSMVMHGSALHLALTMLVAAALGPALARTLHPLAVPALYLAGGLVERRRAGRARARDGHRERGRLGRRRRAPGRGPAPASRAPA